MSEYTFDPERMASEMKKHIRADSKKDSYTGIVRYIIHNYSIDSAFRLFTS